MSSMGLSNCQAQGAAGASGLEAGFMVADRYKIEKELGRGATATVYKAIDQKSQNIVAVKYYADTRMMESKELEYISNEAQTLIGIQNPNVMHCYEIIKGEDKIYVILEYIKGITLTEFIQQQFKDIPALESMLDVKALYEQLKPLENSSDLRYKYQSIVRNILKDKIAQQINCGTLMKGFNPQSQCRPIYNLDVKVEQKQQQQSTIENVDYFKCIPFVFKQLVNVLVELDKQKIMHRDLKPDNIMITPEMRLVLIDFGFCKKNTNQNQTGYIGTPGYMAPEIHQVNASKEFEYSSKVDVWSCGCIFFQMLYGYRSFLVTKNMRFEVLQAKKGLYLPPNLYSQGLDVDTRFSQAIEMALRVNPNTRATATELLQLASGQSPSTLAKTITIRIAFAGEYGVGKSTLMKRMALSTHDQIEKIQRRFITLNGKNVELEFTDTCGTEAGTQSLVMDVYKKADICFLVYNNTKADSCKALNMWLNVVKKFASTCLFFVLANKFGPDVPVEEVKGVVFKENVSGEECVETVLNKAIAEFMKVSGK